MPIVEEKESKDYSHVTHVKWLTIVSSSFFRLNFLMIMIDIMNINTRFWSTLEKHIYFFADCLIKFEWIYNYLLDIYTIKKCSNESPAILVHCLYAWRTLTCTRNAVLCGLRYFKKINGIILTMFLELFLCWFFSSVLVSIELLVKRYQVS